MWCAGARWILMRFSFLSDDHVFFNLFCNYQFSFASVATRCRGRDEWLRADCLSSGCSIDWEWSHASKSYVVSFISSTSGKRTLERDVTICFYSDKEASQACISPAWRTHRPISTTRQWSHHALSLRVLTVVSLSTMLKILINRSFTFQLFVSLLKRDVNQWWHELLHTAHLLNVWIIFHCHEIIRLYTFGECKWKFYIFDWSCL